MAVTCAFFREEVWIHQAIENDLKQQERGEDKRKRKEGKNTCYPKSEFSVTSMGVQKSVSFFYFKTKIM
jgi:hypothetical protein